MTQTSQSQRHVDNPYADLAAADCAHWKALIARIEEPAVAQLLVEYLDSQPELQLKRSGVYLSAHLTLEREAQRLRGEEQRAEQALAVGRNLGLLVRGGAKTVHRAFKLACTAWQSISSMLSGALEECQPVDPKHTAPVAKQEPSAVNKPTSDGTESVKDHTPNSAQQGAVNAAFPKIIWPDKGAGSAAVH